MIYHNKIIQLFGRPNVMKAQALVSFKKYMPPPLPYFKVNIYQLYRYTPEIFLFSTATFKYIYRAPLRQIGQE
jgi:hypothetical protein